jgi:hypothetical protein
MKQLLAMAAGCLVVCGASASIRADQSGSEVNQQLAQARAATARFHDPNEALADGYTDMGANPEEGGAIEFVNFNLVDCTLDQAHPEALRYVPSGNGLRLVAVEFAIPMACPGAPPEDFLPGTGEWEQEPDAPVWILGVQIWSGKSGEAQ